MNKKSVRTCIGCRERDTVTALARLCLWDGQVVAADGRSRGQNGGRGASVHPRAACVQRAVASGAFSRAFRARALPSAETVVALSGVGARGNWQGQIEDRRNREQP